MSEIVNFIKENSKMIMIIVIVVFILLVVINIKGIVLNSPKPATKLIQQVTVETLKMMNNNPDTIASLKLNPVDSFCESYLGNSSELEIACNELTKTNCAQTKCCVFANTGENSKCVAGGIGGPTYKTDKDGKLITIDSYYYLGKCRGSCST